jgi:hypothetical protein
MAMPEQWIGTLRSDVGNILSTLDRLAGARRQYDSLGGLDFIDDFFTRNPTYDITADDIGNALNSLQAIADLLLADGGGHGTNLNKVR